VLVLSLPKPESAQKGKLLRDPIVTRDWIWVKVVFLVGAIAGQ
jgi:hypothetical protein